MDAWFLNQTDRSKAVARVNENLTGIKNNEFKWAQCFEALMDPKTWFIFCIQVASNIPNGGVTTVRYATLQKLHISLTVISLVQLSLKVSGSAHSTPCF